jgi:uncharacterized membrane protein
MAAADAWRRAWLPLGVVVLAFIPIVAGSFRLAQLLAGAGGMEPDARFDAAPAAVVVHIAASIIYVLLGGLQFSRRLRRRRTWHRRAGRLLVPLGLAIALSALWMTLLYERKEGTGDLLYGVRLLVASYMAAALALGFAAIRRGDVSVHRGWMIRAYALALGAGTQAFTVGFGEAMFGSGVIRTDLMMSAGWALNLAIAELIISRSRRPGRGRDRQEVQTQTHAVTPRKVVHVR